MNYINWIFKKNRILFIELGFQLAIKKKKYSRLCPCCKNPREGKKNIHLFGKWNTSVRVYCLHHFLAKRSTLNYLVIIKQIASPEKKSDWDLTFSKSAKSSTIVLLILIWIKITFFQCALAECRAQKEDGRELFGGYLFAAENCKNWTHFPTFFFSWVHDDGSPFLTRACARVSASYYECVCVSVAPWYHYYYSYCINPHMYNNDNISPMMPETKH